MPPSDLSSGRRRLDAAIAAFVRLVLRIFFRRVEVAGVERLPRGRPLVVVANHVNAMVDPLLLLGTLPLAPRFLGKSTLWRNPFLAPWLRIARVIPVYRRQDERSDPAAAAAPSASRNDAMFERCHEVLHGGGAIALFPEGISHSLPALAPMKTGAARIVLEAERKWPGMGTAIVPVGLSFDAKGTFRSRALVQVGEPIDPVPEIAAADMRPDDPESNAAAVRQLTARIDAGLQAVTLNYPSWDEARLLGRAAELFAHGAAELPGRPGLASAFPLHRTFIDGYRDLSRRFPERTAGAAAAVERYDRLLAAVGLRDDQVAAAYPPSPVVRFVLRSLLRLLVHLPLAALGVVLCWPVYRLIGEIARRAARRDADLAATFKVFGGLVLYPLSWLAEAALAAWLGRATGHPLALAVATLVTAPLAGYAALRFDDRRAVFWREARAYLVLRTRRRLAAELRALRDEALEQVKELAELVGAEG
ncbi:MAG TPA: 1-acyl-sn-glycerol-3-phosphate acyltransferase [Thermoanaerobaculia bacterium]